MVEICVGALVLQQEGQARILLGKRTATRAAYPSVWDMPGGHCEEGEAPEHTLVRELQEEIGITPTQWHAADTLTGTAAGGEELVLHVYAVTAWMGTPTNRQPDEHSKIAWFTLDTACELDLADAAYPALFRRILHDGEN